MRKKGAGRPKLFADDIVMSLRIERELHDMLHDIAALESLNTGTKVSVQELIRNALRYTYSDNERLRECFRRSRAHVHNKIHKKY